ncbi:unnamed protein product [Pylaiella littoralis]
MNPSLLAALASPGGTQMPTRSNSRMNTATASRATRTSIPGGTTRAGALSSGPSHNKENIRLGAKSRAPSFTVREPPSTPGRMENLRVLIEEGKKAAEEGRLVAALRKFETAMVTLPEAYKPRLRNKIARLEARLDDEEDGSPRTPGRSSSKACREAAHTLDKDPGLLDLLNIAVQDVTAAAAAAATEGEPSSGHAVRASSSCSPRRSSPLVRGLVGSGFAMPCVSGVGEGPMPEDSSSGLDIDRLGDRLAASSFPAGAARAGASASSLRSPTPSQAAKRGGGGNGDRRLHAGFSVCKEASPSSGTRTGEDDGYCGLGGVEGEALSDEEDAVETEAVDTQERLRAINRGLSEKLEKQVVDIMNQASSDELTELHGIGPRRAQLILQTRAATPFKTLADLACIGMYPKQIVKMGRQNMLECLDVCHHAKKVDTTVGVGRGSTSK